MTSELIKKCLARFPLHSPEAKGLITTIVDNLRDDDDDVRAASVRAMAKLKNGKSAHRVTSLRTNRTSVYDITPFIIKAVVPHVADVYAKVRDASYDVLLDLACTYLFNDNRFLAHYSVNPANIPSQAPAPNHKKDDDTVSKQIVAALNNQMKIGNKKFIQ